MNRRAAYFSILKFNFQGALILRNPISRREAYQTAKRIAAESVFLASTDSLTTWVPV